MNDNDLTLIIDLVDGRLSPDGERTARDRILADPELRAAYETQMAVAARLGTADLPSMTPPERDRLHASLKAQLHLEDAPSAPVRTPSRMGRWFAPLTGLAVAAAIVGAVVILPRALDGGRSDDSLQVASAPTTTAPAAATAPDAGVASAETFEEQSSPGTAGTAMPATTTAAAAPPPVDSDRADTTAAPPPVESDQADTTAEDSSVGILLTPVPFVSGITLDELSASLAANPSLSASDLGDRSSAGDPGIPTDRVLSCVDAVAAGAGDSVVAPLVLTAYDGTDAIVMTVTPAGADPYLAVYSIASCEELADTRP